MWPRQDKITLNTRSQKFPIVLKLYFPISDLVLTISFHFYSRMDKEAPASENEVSGEDQENYGKGDTTDAKPDRKGRFKLFGNL